MAVSTINPWAAGAVVFDERPWQSFYERQSLRQQAKNDALENYFKDLNKNITSSGMRSQDVPTLLQKQQEWQQLGIQNKDKLLNPKIDNGQTLIDYQRRYNEMQGLINESKEAMKSMDAIGKMKTNPQMSYVFEDPHLMEQIKRHDLPIGDPSRQGINLATLTLPPAPITTKDLEAYNKYLTGNIPFDKVPGQTENLGGFKTRTAIHQQFSPENLRVIGDHAANAYDTDKRWRLEATKYWDEIKHNPEEYKRANTTFKQLYGGDIDDPKEAWMAKGILDNNMKATEYKEGTDTYGRELALMGMRQKNAKELIDYKKKIDPNDTELNNSWVRNFWQTSISEAKNDPNKGHVIYRGNNFNGKAYEIDSNPVLMKAFVRGAGKNAVEPDRIYVTEDNRILPIYYKYTSEGKVATNSSGHPLVDEDYSRPMSLQNAELALGYRGQTKKQLAETMSSNKPINKSFKIDGKSYTRKQLNDMGYDDKEIDQYINQGIIQ